jgi:hypothetical protein
MKRAAIVLWRSEFVSKRQLDDGFEVLTLASSYLLEGNCFFRLLLRANGSYPDGSAPGGASIPSDELLSSSSRGVLSAVAVEAHRICSCRALKQGRHIGHDGRRRDRLNSVNAIVDVVA